MSKDNEISTEELEDLFDDWNSLKQELHFDKKTYPKYQEREIWWVAIGRNIGTEVYGKGKDHLRPVLIIKKFGRSFLGIPLTSQYKENNPHFYPIVYNGKKESWAMLTQFRLFDAKRLFSKPKDGNKIPSHLFEEIKKAIMNTCL
jgi:hypothetical protein